MKNYGFRIPSYHGTSFFKKIKNKKRDFVYLKRHLPPDVTAKIIELNIPGIFLKREFRRYYPAGEMTAHILGFTDVDDNGQEGIESLLLHWRCGSVF